MIVAILTDLLNYCSVSAAAFFIRYSLDKFIQNNTCIYETFIRDEKPKSFLKAL